MSSDLSSLQALRSDASQSWVNYPIPENVTDPETYKAARGFEAYFARYLVDQLKGEMNMIGGKGYGGEVYQQMWAESIGSEIAGAGALGITEMIYRQLMFERGQEPYAKLGSIESLTGARADTESKTAASRKVGSVPRHR